MKEWYEIKESTDLFEELDDNALLKAIFCELHHLSFMVRGAFIGLVSAVAILIIRMLLLKL